MGTCNQTPCGDITSPPTRGNMSIFAIIELVIMGVVGIICLVNLVNMVRDLTDSNSKHSFNEITILQIIEFTLIVAGLCFILIGLFCSISSYHIRTGILCFCIGTIVAVVLTILIIYRGLEKDDLFFNICYIIFLIFLAYILWLQSGRL